MREKSNLIEKIFRNRFRRSADIYADQYHESQQEGEIETYGFPTQQGAYQDNRY